MTATFTPSRTVEQDLKIGMIQVFNPQPERLVKRRAITPFKSLEGA